jgi:tRNA A-37 threonylcarbamoyl transferase component Bud32
VIGDILQDTYRVERVIGKGTMGVVYEAAHLRFSRRFAIKVLSPELTMNQEVMARFRREAEVTGALGHPHILQVIDFNSHNDCPYIVMELLVGENLGDRIARDGQMTLEAVSSVFSQTASALDAVHACGIVHRDLKPTNIYLCCDGREDDFVRVLDFGISKVLGADRNLTAADAVLGSPQYMAPEQAVGRSAEVDRRADIYAMGAILYEMLSGEAPFERATSLSDLLKRIVDVRPAPLRVLRPDVPISVERVVARALEKRPEDRFEAMADFWVAFEQCLGRSRHTTELSVARARAAAPDEGEPSTMPGVRWRPAPVPDADRTVVEDRPPAMDAVSDPAVLHPVATDPALQGGLTDPHGFRAAVTDPVFEDPTVAERQDPHVATTGRYVPVDESGAQAAIIDSLPVDDSVDVEEPRRAPGRGAVSSDARVTSNVRIGAGAASRTWLLLLVGMAVLLGAVVGVIIYFVSDVPAWPTAHPDAAAAPAAPARR